MSSFSVVLRELRKRDGLSQRQLAERLGVTKSVISYYELSERVPSPDVLVKIAGVFHVTTDYLMGLDSRTMINISDLPLEDVKLLESIAAALRLKNSQIGSGE